MADKDTVTARSSISSLATRLIVRPADLLCHAMARAASGFEAPYLPCPVAPRFGVRRLRGNGRTHLPLSARTRS
jgi:hypothetical protein